jgi:uncharacterized Zn finger protein
MSRSGRFGRTWWGKAWIGALEGRARLDPNRLPRGRTYARQGSAEEITLEPGRIVAQVRGRRPRPYRVEIRVRELTAGEWSRVFAVIASRAARAAALLDGELEPGVDSDAREVGVELLPDAGEVQPRCSCPDWADPCKHAAAVCYLTADELDADPFLLFRLRGRDRDQVMAGVRAARADAGGASPEPPAPAPAPSPSTVRASDAFAAWSATGDRLVPELPEPPPAPIPPAPWPVDPQPETGLDGAELHHLAADAASRAWAVLRGGEPAMLGLSERHDLARRAASALGSPRFDDLAARTGMSGRSLARLAIAWREGRGPGVDALEAAPWRPSPEPLIAARQALDEAGTPMAEVKIVANRVTVGGQFQLRFGTDRRWYRFEKVSGAWELAGPPVDDPADLV